MTNGWEASAAAWIDALDDYGDWARQHVLDPIMLARAGAGGYHTALDVGCGEGRFCRMLRQKGIEPIGIDPTAALLREATQRDPEGQYQIGCAEKLNFSDNLFDLVVSYVTLPDITDFRAAIREMTRVLKPGGTLLIANLTSFTSAYAPQGWVEDDSGRRHSVDRYLEEFSYWTSWSNIRIQNWHRPLRAYMDAFLENQLQLRFFEEPLPVSGDPKRVENYRRAPWFVVMEWAK
jgi:SAM-dependent methyltransferase